MYLVIKGLRVDAKQHITKPGSRGGHIIGYKNGEPIYGKPRAGKAARSEFGFKVGSKLHQVETLMKDQRGASFSQLRRVIPDYTELNGVLTVLRARDLLSESKNEHNQVIYHAKRPSGKADLPVLYHGTSTAALEHIKLHGLKPAGSGADQWGSTHGYQLIESGGRELSVYMSLHPVEAMNYGVYASLANEGSKPVLLRINIPTSERKKLLGDEAVYSSNTALRLQGTIDPKWIEVVPPEEQTGYAREGWRQLEKQARKQFPKPPLPKKTRGDADESTDKAAAVYALFHVTE